MPTGLVILGASLSGLSLRNKKLPPWYQLPRSYHANCRSGVVLMALLKLGVLPVLGVLWTQLLTYHSPLVSPDQIMLRFVMMLLSGGIKQALRLTNR